MVHNRQYGYVCFLEAYIIIGGWMGNNCEGCECDEQANQYNNRIADFPRTQQITSSMHSFPQYALQVLLKQSHPLVLKLNQQQKSQINNTIQKRPTQGQLSLDPTLFLKYNSNGYMYLGEHKAGILNSTNACVIFEGKVWKGAVSNHRIAGAGEVTWKITNQRGIKKITAKGQWTQSIIEVNLHIQCFPIQSANKFSINKKQLSSQQYVYVRYHNCSEYVGTVRNGKAHGSGTYIYRQGQAQSNFPYYIGQFKEGLRDGQGTMYYSAQMNLSIVWSKGKPDGSGKMSIKGQVFDVNYIDGVQKLRVPTERDNKP